MRRHLLLATTLLASAGPLSVAPAFAQTDTAGDTAHVQEVVVTARRREENLQSVPVAITAMSGNEIAERGATDLIQVAKSVPTLVITTSTGNRNATNSALRGQQEGSNLFTVDQTVGVYVNEIYQARAYGVLGDLLDIGSIEVLKGPQGTLFGRNTTGGALLITTERPDPSGGLTGFVRAQYGNFDSHTISGAVNLPVIPDVLAVRLAALNSAHDGYTTMYFAPPGSGANANFLNYDTDDKNAQSYRVSVAITPMERLRVDLSADWYRAADHGTLFLNSYGDVVGPATPPATGNVFTFSAQHRADYYSGQSDSLPYSYVRAYGTRAALEYEFSDSVRAKLIYGYRRSSTGSATGTDGNYSNFPRAANGNSTPPGATFSTTQFLQGQHQNSVEAQLAGQALGDRLDWIIGAYYFNEAGFDFQNQDPPPLGVGINRLTGTDIRAGYGRNKSKSVFGHVKYEITEQLTASLGLRYTEDEKSLVATDRTATGACAYTNAPPLVIVGPGVCEIRTDTKDDFTSVSADVSYQFTPDIFAYAKFGTGYRSGGGQARAVSNSTAIPFGPEKVKSFEVGLKTEWFGSRLRFNIDAFYDKRKDLQLSRVVNVPPILTTVTENTGNVKTYGVEMDAEVVLGGGFSAQGQFGFFQEDHSGFVLGGVPTRVLNLHPISYALSLNYEREFDLGRLRARVDMNHVPRFYGSLIYPGVVTRSVDGQVHSYAPSYEVVNARIGLTLKNDVEVALWSKNLLKEKYYRAVFSSGALWPATFGDPRTYGLEIGYRF